MWNLLSFFVLFCLHKDVILSGVTNQNTPKKVFYQLEDIDVLFKEFAAKYDRKYSSGEYEHRYKVFTDNLININHWNREQPHATFSIGPFADLTFEEFIESHTGFLGNFTSENAVEYEPKGMAPESLDWRERNIVTRVKDQESCGSCYIFAAIGNIESLHAKNGGQLIELSEQQSLDCNSKGCGGGLPHEVMQALASRGCMRESDYPYEGQQRQCRMDASKVVVRVSGGAMLAIRSEDDLKDAVAHYGPLAIGIYLDPQMQHLPRGIFIPTACNVWGHALLLVGYGTENGTPYWLIKNSWGASWGENGYFRMIRNQGACQIGSYVASATVA